LVVWGVEMRNWVVAVVVMCVVRFAIVLLLSKC